MVRDFKLRGLVLGVYNLLIFIFMIFIITDLCINPSDDTMMFMQRPRYICIFNIT